LVNTFKNKSDKLYKTKVVKKKAWNNVTI